MKTEVERLIDRVRGDPSYVAFLLVERPYIRSALLARGTPLDEVDRTLSYSPSIGNAFHDDLIELEMWLEALAPADRELLLLWANKEERAPSFGRAAIRRVGKLIRDHARKQAQADGETSS